MSFLVPTYTIAYEQNGSRGLLKSSCGVPITIVDRPTAYLGRCKGKALSHWTTCFKSDLVISLGYCQYGRPWHVDLHISLILLPDHSIVDMCSLLATMWHLASKKTLSYSVTLNSLSAYMSVKMNPRVKCIIITFDKAFVIEPFVLLFK